MNSAKTYYPTAMRTFMPILQHNYRLNRLQQVYDNFLDHFPPQVADELVQEFSETSVKDNTTQNNQVSNLLV